MNNIKDSRRNYKRVAVLLCLVIAAILLYYYNYKETSATTATTAQLGGSYNREKQSLADTFNILQKFV